MPAPRARETFEVSQSAIGGTRSWGATTRRGANVYIGIPTLIVIILLILLLT
jgi:hypothetical protein